MRGGKGREERGNVSIRMSSISIQGCVFPTTHLHTYSRTYFSQYFSQGGSRLLSPSAVSSSHLSSHLLKAIHNELDHLFRARSVEAR